MKCITKKVKPISQFGYFQTSVESMDILLYFLRKVDFTCTQRFIKTYSEYVEQLLSIKSNKFELEHVSFILDTVLFV